MRTSAVLNRSCLTCAAGQDATDAFYSLHRSEVLIQPRYKRLVIGTVQGAKAVAAPAPDALSRVPYGEPMSLTPGYHSPYFSENHRAFHKAARKFSTEVLLPEGLQREEDGKRISQEALDKMRCLHGCRLPFTAERHSSAKLDGTICA